MRAPGEIDKTLVDEFVNEALSINNKIQDIVEVLNVNHDFNNFFKEGILVSYRKIN